MTIERQIKNDVIESLATRKVVIIYGPRQAGKTTLLNTVISQLKIQDQIFNGDDLYTQNKFAKPELEALKSSVGHSEYLIIDEAQRIQNIGLILKLIVDNLPVKILVSGSSSFELSNQVNEPLTGRSQIFQLYPLSYKEVLSLSRQILPETQLEQMLRFGMYPQIYNLVKEEEKQNYLDNLVNNYLYQDILNFQGIKKPKVVVDLLTLLALQIGKEVSVAELAQNLSINQQTVNTYLDLLEKMFVIINIRGFSRNLRKEVYKTSKYYFIDLGLRNSLIRNYNQLKIRQDVGDMFENWFIIEKIKLSLNSGKRSNFYFWRTYDQQEIDLIEEKGGIITGFECKWSKIKTKIPKEFLETYKNSEFQVITQDNYLDFIT